LTAIPQQVFPLLKYVPEALPLSVMGSALARSGSILELAGIGSYQTRVKLLAASHRSHTYSLPLPKCCHANPQHRSKIRHPVVNTQVSVDYNFSSADRASRLERV